MMRFQRLGTRFLVGIAVWLLLPVQAGADPIHDAANSGDVETVQRLLKEDSKRVNARTPGGATPLLRAAIRGQSAVVKILVENGADVNLAQGDGWTPLHAAVCDGNDAAHIEITRLLLEHGAKMEAPQQAGLTPLHVATPFRPWTRVSPPMPSPRTTTSPPSKRPAANRAAA